MVMALFAGCGNKGQSASLWKHKDPYHNDIKGRCIQGFTYFCPGICVSEAGVSYDTVYAEESAEAQVEQVKMPKARDTQL